MESYMKSGKIILLSIITALLFLSCPMSSDDSDGGGGAQITNPTNVPPRTFWAQNTSTEVFYLLTAELLAEGSNCRVWAETGSGITRATANSMARAYENEILPKMMNTFGDTRRFVDENNQTLAVGTMGWADYNGDGDGKLCLLLLDIKDDHNPPTNTAYVGGYFDWRNFLSRSVFQYSNECDMIYIDTSPAIPGSKDSNATVAHEMQHLMNFITSTFARYDTKNNAIYLMDTWVNEGLSSAAEQLVLGEHVDWKINQFNYDLSGLIKKGNNFFVWGNREGEHQNAVLDDYATVYLFFQWLRLQSGSSDIYKDTIMSNQYDYKAVTGAASGRMSGNNYSNWPTLLKTWLAANYINSPSGPYGYRNDSKLKNIQAKTAPGGTTSLPLYPGEGVYSITSGTSLPSNTTYINYAGLNKSGAQFSESAAFAGGALLTFNSNSNINGATASGTVTGVTSIANASMSLAEESLMLETFLKGPFPISARDMLRRNGKALPALEIEMNGLKKRALIIEQ